MLASGFYFDENQLWSGRFSIFPIKTIKFFKKCWLRSYQLKAEVFDVIVFVECEDIENCTSESL
jgi:hypothetical protein